MNKSLSVHITSHGEIKTGLNCKFRHVIIEDINNYKKVEYILFQNSHSTMWRDLMKSPTQDLAYPGEIISLTITNDLIRKVKKRSLLKVKEGNIVDIVVWFWNDWGELSYEMRIIRSFEDQIGRFIKYIRPKTI